MRPRAPCSCEQDLSMRKAGMSPDPQRKFSSIPFGNIPETPFSQGLNVCVPKRRRTVSKQVSVIEEGHVLNECLCEIQGKLLVNATADLELDNSEIRSGKSCP